MQKSVLGKACLAVVSSGPGERAGVPPGRARAAARRDASFSVKQTRVPLGSPVEVTYKFVVEKNAPPIH